MAKSASLNHWRLVVEATSEHPNGPLHLHYAFHPSGLPSLDLSLYQLPADEPYGKKAHIPPTPYLSSTSIFIL
jgi:hypothetical protein